MKVIRSYVTEPKQKPAPGTESRIKRGRCLEEIAPRDNLFRPENEHENDYLLLECSPWDEVSNRWNSVLDFNQFSCGEGTRVGDEER